MTAVYPDAYITTKQAIDLYEWYSEGGRSKKQAKHKRREVRKLTRMVERRVDLADLYNRATSPGPDGFSGDFGSEPDAPSLL